MLTVNSTGGSLAQLQGVVMTDDLGTVVLVSGAVGEPGQRVFYLQAQGPLGTHTVKCEKGQVAALAEHLERLLADLPAIGATALVPTDLEPSCRIRPASCSAPSAWPTTPTPTASWSCSRRWPPSTRTTTSRSSVERDGLRLEITRGVASVFCARAKEIVAAGRPSCRWCGRPIDPDGHPCPRMN